MIKATINNYLCGSRGKYAGVPGGRMTRKVLCGVLLVAAAAATRAGASFPVGVYAIVDKVVFEPAEAEAQRVQIWGVFALWEDGEATGYRAPQRGFLYYTC